MKEIVVISGKGGTGKTSLLASFAALADRPVLADCDVDAADLHLVIEPRVIKSETFIGGKEARIRPGHCVACGKCEEVCRFDAIYFDGPGNGKIPRTFRVNPIQCEGCGVCAWFCNHDAIAFEDTENGRWHQSETRHGPMIHARMDPGAENSGKMVSLLRMKAREVAETQQRETILVDGSPGIGCAVIASITNSDLVVIVTEPTQSGLHDFQRVAKLTAFFTIPACLVVNKWDLNPDMTENLRRAAEEHNIVFAGKVSYDPAVTSAQIARKSVVEYQADGIAREIRSIWDTIQRHVSATAEQANNE